MRMETWEERKNPRKDSKKKLFLILPMTAFLAELYRVEPVHDTV